MADEEFQGAPDENGSRTYAPENRVKGGRPWTRHAADCSPGWESDDGDYDILEHETGYVVLVSFIHDPIDDAQFWRKRFGTVREAMEYVEMM